MSSDPHLDATGISQRQFTTTRRGYDADEVRNYLRELANWVGGLQRREAEANERATQAEARARKAEQLDEHRLVEILGEETARVLDAARAAATDIRTKAEESAARLIKEANQEAHRLTAEGEAAIATQRLELLGEVEGLRTEATTELDRRRAEAAQVAAGMRREAQAECDALRQDGEKRKAQAEATADEIRAQAEEEGRQLVAEAQLVRSRVLGDLARRRHTAREQLERLHGARERLLAAYEVVRRTVDEATAELIVVLPEAKIASDTAMRRASQEPEPSVEQLENMVAMARITGLIDEAADPVFGDDGYAPDDAGADPSDAGSSHSSDTSDPVVVDGDDADAAEVVDADDTDDIVGFDDDVGVDDVDVDVLVVGTSGGRGVYDIENEPLEDDEDLEPVVEVEVGIAASPAPPTVFVPAPDEVDEGDDEPYEAGDDFADHTELEEGLDDRDVGSRGVGHEDQELVDDLYFDEGDQAGEGEHDEWGVVDDQRPATSAVDALFARLKAGRDEPPPVEELETEVVYDDAYGSYEDAGDEHDQTADSRQRAAAGAGSFDFEAEMAVLAATDENTVAALVGAPSSDDETHEHDRGGASSDPTGSDASEAEPEAEFEDMDPDEALLRLRDDSLAGVEHDMGRKLKRVLSNEQNEVLDLLRRTKAKNLDELLPEGGAAHAARYSSAALEGLTAAATRGADSVEGQARGSCQLLAEQLGRQVVDPLRERMARSFLDSGGDVEEVTNRLRALYREWKGHHIAAAVEHYAVAAYSQGAYSAVPDGTAVRWLVDRGSDACPDADDNALANGVCKGEAFPTGDRCAPAHPGCRCLVVPLDWPKRG